MVPMPRLFWLAIAHTYERSASPTEGSGCEKWCPSLAARLLTPLSSWSIWLQRNDRVFSRASIWEAMLASSIMANLELWMSAKLVVRSYLLRD
jgi:hypothetical protein